jgi:pimeloyl-ACP methyl ester carboxylesterase
MPTFQRGDISLYYEEYGSGYPLLLLAPGGVKSSIGFWKITPNGEKNPLDPTVDLARDFRVIAMDQRNAGRSRGPVSAADGWHTYTADHLAQQAIAFADALLGRSIGRAARLAMAVERLEPVLEALERLLALVVRLRHERG